MRLILFLLLSTSVFCSAHADEFDAKVIAVMDGDTLMVLRDGKKVKVRLANIDAPESDQAFGKESRQALSEKVLKKKVRINSRAVDSYGRLVADVHFEGQSVNEAQVNAGMAWANSHSYRDQRYLDLHQQAKASRRGLWAQVAQPVAPEQWRKSHPSQTSSAKPGPVLQANSACGKKHLCRQMKSCEEAKIYLLQCGVKTLDRNGNGVPCENLCVAESALLP